MNTTNEKARALQVMQISGRVLDGAHLCGLLGGFKDSSRNLDALARARGNHPIGKARREDVRPLRDSLRVDSNGFCGLSDSPAKKFKGLFLLHSGVHVSTLTK